METNERTKGFATPLPTGWKRSYWPEPRWTEPKAPWYWKPEAGRRGRKTGLRSRVNLALCLED